MTFLNHLLRVDENGLVKECSWQVVEDAVRLVVAADERQPRFIKKIGLEVSRNCGS